MSERWVNVDRETPLLLPVDLRDWVPDSDSALVRKSKHASYEQAYNAQAVVDADGSQLIVATDVLRTPAD